MKLRYKWALLAAVLSAAVVAVVWAGALLFGAQGFAASVVVLMAAGAGYFAGKDEEGR